MQMCLTVTRCMMNRSTHTALTVLAKLNRRPKSTRIAPNVMESCIGMATVGAVLIARMRFIPTKTTMTALSNLNFDGEHPKSPIPPLTPRSEPLGRKYAPQCKSF